MEEPKKWYESKAVWANILGIVVSLAASFGLITTDQGAIVIKEVPEFLAMFGTLITSAFGLYGRVVATKAIGPTPAVTSTATPNITPIG